MLNTVIAYDTHGKGIPYLSSTFKYDSDVKLIETVLGVLTVLIEYRPPTKENVAYLIENGLTSLLIIKQKYVEIYVHEGDEKHTDE